MGHTANIMDELSLVYRAVRDTCPWIQEETKDRGRKPYNRALILAILILGIQRGWSYRRMEQFCMENMKAIKRLDPAWESYPDHGVFYLAARSISIADVSRISARVKKLKGEIPVLWY
jgi:hypothetical protein